MERVKHALEVLRFEVGTQINKTPGGVSIRTLYLDNYWSVHVNQDLTVDCTGYAAEHYGRATHFDRLTDLDVAILAAKIVNPE